MQGEGERGGCLEDLACRAVGTSGRGQRKWMPGDGAGEGGEVGRAWEGQSVRIHVEDRLGGTLDLLWGFRGALGLALRQRGAVVAVRTEEGEEEAAGKGSLWALGRLMVVLLLVLGSSLLFLEEKSAQIYCKLYSRQIKLVYSEGA